MKCVRVSGALAPYLGVWFLLASTPAWTATRYNGAAAGDATEGGVILWTRTLDADTGHWIQVDLLAQVAADPLFHNLLSMPGAVDTVATAINNNGVIVGAYDTPDTTHGFVTFDMGQTCTQIDYPDAPNTQVMGITTSGTLVGFYFDDDVNYIRSFVATPN